MSTPWTVMSSPLPSVVNAAALTTGTASSTPGTAAARVATSSEKSAPWPAAISSAARPAIVSTTSTNANSTARFTTSMAHTSATPNASAMRVRARRPTWPRRRRNGNRRLGTLITRTHPWPSGSEQRLSGCGRGSPCARLLSRSTQGRALRHRTCRLDGRPLACSGQNAPHLIHHLDVCRQVLGAPTEQEHPRGERRRLTLVSLARDRPFSLQRLALLPELGVKLAQKFAGSDGVQVSQDRETVGKRVGRSGRQRVDRRRQPRGEGIAALVGDPVRHSPGIGSRRIRRCDDEPLCCQARELPVDIADAQPNSGPFPVRRHQRIAMRGGSIRQQCEQHVPKHERGGKYPRHRNCVKHKTVAIQAYIAVKTDGRAIVRSRAT